MHTELFNKPQARHLMKKVGIENLTKLVIEVFTELRARQLIKFQFGISTCGIA